ncbi:hypothetical protein ISCGN_005553 [Ixodes scapularis]
MIMEKNMNPLFVASKKLQNVDRKRRKLLHRSQEVHALRHSQYGDVQRAGRSGGGVRRTNVPTGVEPLLRNCRSLFRSIDLAAQNIERKGYKCETIARQTVHETSSLSSSASPAGEANKKNK